MFEEKIQVKYSEIDYKQAVKPSAILNFFQDMASENAENLGFGYSFITKSKDTALGYATRCDGKGDETSVFMEILLPSGSKISKNPFHLREAVMPRCAKYEVAGKKEENGMYSIISSIKKMITVRASRCYNLFHGKHDTWRASTP